jgi:methyl-accepting chemotaxis protein
MRSLAVGDLTATVKPTSAKLAIDGADEIADLAGAYNNLLTGIEQIAAEFGTTTATLSSLVAQIKASAYSVESAAKEIAEGSDALSVRTDEQASGLEEASASMEEITSTVKQNADSARQADSYGETVQNEAQRSGSAMSVVVTTMKEVNESSRRIVEIISVIDGIAFQTNILALNAAVEAARAGEQGRGFAVVAGEVRGLAQRSASASKEIKGLIEDTVSKVANGMTLIDQAGVTIDGLVRSVKQVSTIVSDIAAASGEQSDGIDQVNNAVAIMDQATQENASLVQQTANAATVLEEQAHALLEATESFKTDASDVATVRVHEQPKKASGSHVRIGAVALN